MAYWKYRVALRRLADDIMFRCLFLSLSLLACCLSAQTMPAFRWIQQVDGSGADSVIGIGTDAAGNVYIAGNTASFDFPVKSAAQNHSASTGLYRIDGSGAAAPLPLAAAQSISVDPKNPKVLYAANNGTALRSVDAGATWSTLAISTAPVRAVQVDPSNSSVLYAATSGLGAFKSVDAGATWTSISAGLAPPNGNLAQMFVNQFWFDPFHPGVLFANSSAGARSTDGGATWKIDPALANLSSVWFDLTTPNLLYATTLANALKSTDDGQTWTVLSNIPGGLSEQTGSLYFITSDPNQPGRLILSTGRSVFESTDDGATFTLKLSQALSQWITPDWANHTLYAQSGGIVKISSDLQTVTPVGPPALPVVNQITVSNGQVYAAVSASNDVFITKLDPNGNIVYSTYFGGSADDSALAMTVDASGNVYVTGMTRSRDFPTTAGAYSKAPPQAGPGVASGSSSFVLKLNPDGSVGYATYVADAMSAPGGIAVNATGEVFIAGTTTGDLPVTPGAYQTSFSGASVFLGGCIFCPPQSISNAFLSKLDSSGASLVFSTYIGSQTATSGPLALASDGSIFLSGGGAPFYPSYSLVGQTIYHMNATGTSLLSTGNGPAAVAALAVGVDGNIYAAGQIPGGTQFPATAGAFQTSPVPLPNLPGQGSGAYAFVTEFTPDLKQTVASTLFGGASGDMPNSIAIDASGNVLIGGATAGVGLPTRTPLVNSFANSTGFVSKFSQDLSTLLFSTYLGDNEMFAVQSVAIAPGGDFVIAGNTGSPNSANSGPLHVWVNKLTAGAPPALRIDAVLNAASLLSAPLSPGETIVVRGSGFASDAQLIIGDSRVTPIAMDSQSITAIVPSNISASAVLVQVQSGGAVTNPVVVPIAASAPGLFSADGSGFGQGYILNADGSRNTPANPAKIGDVVTIFATGVGPVSFDGPYAVAAFTPQVYFDAFYADGVAAFSGPMAGLPGNVYQLKIIIPDPVKANSDLKNFKYAPLISVTLKSNGAASQSGLAISIGY
jgi:uncharacterized protein (TIGR03437 family)